MFAFDVLALIEAFKETKGQRPALRFLALLQDLEPLVVRYVQSAIDMLGLTEAEAIAYVASELDAAITWDWLAQGGRIGARLAAVAEDQDGVRLERWLTRCWDRATADLAA
jgi:hypothetical protein